MGPFFWLPTRGIGSQAKKGSSGPPTPPAPVDLWLSSNGADPSVWPDLSGNNLSITSGDQAAIITSAYNGKQARRFNGSSNFFSGGNILNLTTGVNLVIVICAKFNADSTAIAKSLSGSLNGRYSLGQATNFTALYQDPSGVYSPTGGNKSGLCVISLYLNRTTTTFDIYVNGVLSVSSSITNPDASNYSNSVRFLVGAYNNSDDSGQISYFNGDMCEVFLALPVTDYTTERQALQAYCGTKYAITLGQPQIWTVNFTGQTGLNYVTGSDGLYFIVRNLSGNSQDPWFNTGTENAPGVAGTPIEIDISPTATSAGIANALLAAASNFTLWNLTLDSVSVVRFTSKTNQAFTNSGDNNTGATFTTIQEGSGNS